jgi:predicted phage terminase large subunit-like protein
VGEGSIRHEGHEVTSVLSKLSWLATPAAFAHHLGKGKWQRACHLDLLSRWLAEAAFGQRRRIAVSMGPRHGKSELISHWFPAWYLNLFPDRRIILASYEADFAAHWGRKVRNTIAANANHLRVRLAEDSTAANRWETTSGGGMSTAGVGGPLMGKGAHLLLVDDPIKNAEEAASQTYRDRTWAWWTSTAYTRLEPDGIAVVIMTRWHEDDLVGRLLKEHDAEGEAWDVLSLPALAEEDDPLGRQIDEPLWPARFDRKALDRIRSAVGSYVWTSLYQQRPSPAEGGMFKRHWWRFWRVLPGHFDEVIQSWDFAFKETKHSDFVVGQVWGRRGAEKYLLDQVRARMDFTSSLAAVRNLSLKWPRAMAKLVEGKANGPAVIAALKKEIPGLIEVEPHGSKESRAAAVTPQIEAGNVYLPEATLSPWIHEYVEEHAAFPNGAHDDQVDASSQALARLGLMAAARFTQRPGQYGTRRM